MTHPVESTQEPPTSHFTGRVRWRSVAIPAEHGGWGMLFSPILLGLLVVPSAAGLFLALMVIAAFLARTPLKIIWKDRQRGRRYARTVTAIKVLGIYSLVILFGLTGALIVGGPLPLVPLFLVLPLAIIVLYFDLLSTSRRLLPELIAPVTLSAVVASMALLLAGIGRIHWPSGASPSCAPYRQFFLYGRAFAWIAEDRPLWERLYSFTPWPWGSPWSLSGLN